MWCPADEEAVRPTEQARQLDRNLQRFRVTAKPLLAGVAGPPTSRAGRRSIRRGLRLFTMCDHFGRSLARSSERYQDLAGSHEPASKLAKAFAIIDGADAVTVNSATDDLDIAETMARHQDGEAQPRPDTRRFLTAVHALRQMERAVVTAATNVGASDGLKVTSPTAG